MKFLYYFTHSFPQSSSERLLLHTELKSKYNMDKKHAMLIEAITEYDKGDPKRIHHLLKVHNLAATIGVMEGLDSETQDILESVAILHDIGIHLSEKKYGSSNGKYQEIEGPDEAKKVLKQQGGFTQKEIDRICFLIGHHHTYNKIDGPDYQILVEADFLVNLYEDQCSAHAIEAAGKNIFKTQTGLRLLRDMYAQNAYHELTKGGRKSEH